MEQIPCSHIGHIYREFDRFAVDPGKIPHPLCEQQPTRLVAPEDGRCWKRWRRRTGLPPPPCEALPPPCEALPRQCNTC